MYSKHFFGIGLRVDKEIVDFLDRYHYGTRSEVVRNILYERIADEDPAASFTRLLTSYRRGEIDARTFVKRYIDMKNRCEDVFKKYSQLHFELKNVNVNEIMGRLRLEESVLTLDQY